MLASTSIGDVHHIQLVVHNTGWLPTHISEQGLKAKVVRDLEADIELPEGARLISGDRKQMLGQLKGRDHKSMFSSWNDDTTDDRAKAEWVIEAPAGSEVKLTAVHQRAGTVRVTITVGK